MSSVRESLALQTILEQDPSLSPYTCSITQGIALDPCIEPTNPRQIYHYPALSKWLSGKAKSPDTGKHVTKGEIIRLPKCKEFIEDRINRIFEDPNEELLKAADNELAAHRTPKAS